MADSSILVFAKYPITGVIIELIGFVGLFGYVTHPLVRLTVSSFFPVILQALRSTPFIGTFLSLPYIRQVGAWASRLLTAGCGPLGWREAECGLSTRLSFTD